MDAKISFLQTENGQLKEQIQDLRQVLQMNKTEIDILSKQLQSNQNHKKLIDVIIGYREREANLYKTNSKLKKEMADLTTDNLVLQQMNDSIKEETRNIERLNQSITQSLGEDVKKLEEKLVFYEKNYKEYDKVSGFVLKNREIVGPNELALGLHNREEEWKYQIELMKAEIEQSKKNAENLMIVNTVLRNKIVSLQAKLAMPNKNLGEVLDKSLKRLMIYFIEVQKKIITGEQDSESDEENDLELIAPELSGLFPEKQLRIQKDYGVPHIDLLKIRQQITNSTGKIKEALLARNHLTDKQKIERLEIELEYTRRELSRNIIDLRDEKEMKKIAESFIRELEQRNQLLVMSNKQLEEKVRRYWTKIEEIRMKKDTKVDLNGDFTHNLDETLRISYSKLANDNPTLQKQTSKPNMFEREELIHPADYKIHLQILAKQLQRNKKLKIISNLVSKPKQEECEEEGPPRRVQRSTSNPFLYFNERKEEILHVKDNYDPDSNEEQCRLEQTCVLPGQNRGFEDVLDDLDV